MFSIDQKITDLKIRERTLHKVFFSMNIHPVAALEQGAAEDAKSYVFFFKEGSKFLSFIGLYFIRANRTVYYSYSSNPFSESDLSAVEEEALGFAEEMGAMLDELGLAKMSDVEKDSWIDKQDIFSIWKETEAKAETEAETKVEVKAETIAETKAEEQSTSGSIAQTLTAASSAPVVPEAPSVIVQPAPALVETSAPVQPSLAQQPAPSIPAELPPAPAAQSAAAPSPLPGSQVQAPETSRPQVKRVAVPPRTAVEQPKTAVRDAALSSEDVLEQAVKAGVVKAPKLSAKKDKQSAAGIATRDKEVLARLLASF